jgi:hypothetical protein
MASTRCTRYRCAWKATISSMELHGTEHWSFRLLHKAHDEASGHADDEGDTPEDHRDQTRGERVALW